MIKGRNRFDKARGNELKASNIHNLCAVQFKYIYYTCMIINK